MDFYIGEKYFEILNYDIVLQILFFMRIYTIF